MLKILYFLRLYLKENLIKIPDVVSEVGYNELDWPSLADPLLTVVREKNFKSERWQRRFFSRGCKTNHSLHIKKSSLSRD